MENTKDKYWTEMYDTITNYNCQNNTPLYNSNIREAIDKVIRKEQTEENNVTVDTFSPIRNEGENIINKVASMKINGVRNYLIGCVANVTINYVRNNINRANTSDVKTPTTESLARKEKERK